MLGRAGGKWTDPGVLWFRLRNFSWGSGRCEKPPNKLLFPPFFQQRLFYLREPGLFCSAAPLAANKWLLVEAGDEMQRSEQLSVSLFVSSFGAAGPVCPVGRADTQSGARLLSRGGKSNWGAAGSSSGHCASSCVAVPCQCATRLGCSPPPAKTAPSAA